ncbi:MAG: ABC transporter ATP-binding protein [Bdellovibrionales bacterium]|nr:ABC transporter ATP-binding protein [Bdellovibrionales bacterium]
MNLIAKIMWPELRPYLKRLSVVMLLGIVISGLKGLTPELLRRLTEAWTNGDSQAAFQIPFVLAGAWVVAAIFRYFHMFWMLFTADQIALNLRRKLMNKYLTLNLGFFNSFVRGSGGLISRMLNDITVIQGGFQRVADLVREPFMIIFMFGYLLYVDWRLTLTILVVAPIISVVLRKFSRSVRKYAKHNQESVEELTQTLKESLDGTRIVQSFNLQNEMRNRFEQQAQTFLASKAKIISREEASGPVSEVIAAIFVAFMLAYIGSLGTKNEVGHFMSYLFALGLLSDSVKKLQDSIVRLQQGAVALERLDQILNDTRVVPEIGNPQPFPQHWDGIEFRNVSFGYGDNIVLKNVNLKIQHGEQVALVGTSGAGKSTLINLLPRFFDPSEGDIFIGNVSIRDMKLDELRSNVALVTQDVFLFSDSVERNIQSGDFRRPLTEVLPAAKLANADEFIRNSEHGYETRVGERGARFSGGEKQRISIARAIFKNAPILILDEATSALDSESELEVQKGLDSLMRGKTALVIAHRLSTIAKCDRILVMDKGEVIEEGSHNELMVRQGAYYKFFQIQSRL